MGDQRMRTIEQRIMGLIHLDLCARQIGCHNIGPGVAIKPHSTQMQERWLAVRADPMRGFLCSRKGGIKIQTIRVKVLQSGTR